MHPAVFVFRECYCCTIVHWLILIPQIYYICTGVGCFVYRSSQLSACSHHLLSDMGHPVCLKSSSLCCVCVCVCVCIGRLLTPQLVMVHSRGKVRFVDAFCGAYSTFAVSKDGHVYGFGLSNYHQLGDS